MTTTPTLETLVELAEARGKEIGMKDALAGREMTEADGKKCIADLLLLYMVFLDDEDTDSEIYTDYILSEFMLAYTFAQVSQQ